MTTYNNIQQQSGYLNQIVTEVTNLSVMLEAPVDADAPAGVPEAIAAARASIHEATANLDEADRQLGEANRIYYDNLDPQNPS